MAASSIGLRVQSGFAIRGEKGAGFVATVAHRIAASEIDLRCRAHASTTTLESRRESSRYPDAAARLRSAVRTIIWSVAGAGPANTGVATSAASSKLVRLDDSDGGLKRPALFAGSCVWRQYACGWPSDGVSHTTVARRIAALDQTIGFALFDRRQAGYASTPTDDTLIDQARAVETAAN